MNNTVGTALIKFTDSEIQLLVNSLHMSISTVIPCVDDGEWKRPYKTIKKDLEEILHTFKEKQREMRVDVRDANPKKEYINKITGKEST